MRFSVYVVWLSVSSFNNLQLHKIQKSSKIFTLVPEVFLDISPHERTARERRTEKKPLVTLDLNLTFMQTPGSGSDPGVGLVDIFTNTQINTIGPFDWQYRGDGYCTYCVYITTRKKNGLQNTAVLSLYKRSRFVCVLH